jgi:GWxTD domain-containing protein
MVAFFTKGFKKIGYVSLLVLSLLWFLQSCTDKRVGSRNLSSLYDVDKPYYKLQFSLFHLNEDTTELHFRVPLNEFLYKRDDPVSKFKARFSLTYSFFEDYKTKEILDSAVFYFEDSVHYKQNYWGDYVLGLPIGKYEKGVLRIEVVDKQRKSGATYTFLYNREDKGNEQYFFAEHQDYGRYPGNIFKKSDNVRLHLSLLIKTDSLTVAYFKHFVELAPPPHQHENIKIIPWTPDSLFKIPCNGNVSEYLSFKKEGVYHFMPDSSKREGFTFFIAHDDFPFITSHHQMAGALRYITSHKEFRKIESNPDQQNAIDAFWLGISSNAEVARKLIKEYYSRVQFANVFFTSHKEGWMTDRGMIYIVMGKPNVVYRNTFSEVWIYGEDKNFYSVTFEFRKVLNPLSDNDFVLMRNPTFKDKWYRAVDMWRK